MVIGLYLLYRRTCTGQGGIFGKISTPVMALKYIFPLFLFSDFQQIVKTGF